MHRLLILVTCAACASSALTDSTLAGLSPGTAGWQGTPYRPIARMGPDGAVDLYVRGSDQALWHTSRLDSGTWTGWRSAGGQLAGDPAVVALPDGAAAVFVRGGSDGLWMIWRRPGAPWSGWISLGGVITADP